MSRAVEIFTNGVIGRMLDEDYKSRPTETLNAITTKDPHHYAFNPLFLSLGIEVIIFVIQQCQRLHDRSAVDYRKMCMDSTGWLGMLRGRHRALVAQFAEVARGRVDVKDEVFRPQLTRFARHAIAHTVKAGLSELAAVLDEIRQTKLEDRILI